MSSALPQPPFVEVAGVANFRDVGYVDDGSIVRCGQVYRAADPSKATPQGLEKMSRDLGKIRQCFEGRSRDTIDSFT
jgi:hypothetical protein